MHIFSKKTYRSTDHANSRSKVKILNDACSYNAYAIDYKLTLGILSEHDREMIFGHYTCIFNIYVFAIIIQLKLSYRVFTFMLLHHPE